MAYVEPGITVEQHLRDAVPVPQTSPQPAAIVGPVYQVVKKRSGPNFNYNGDGLADYTYPGMITGSVVEQSTVKVYILKDGEEYDVSNDPNVRKDAGKVDMPANLRHTVAAQKGDGSTAGTILTSPTSDFVAAGVQGGDEVRVGSTSTYLEIASVLSPTQLELEVAPNPVLSGDFMVVRPLWDTPGGDQSTVLISYRAARTDVAVVGPDAFLEVESTRDLTRLFGADGWSTDENPLGYGMSLALSASGRTVAGVGIDANKDAAAEYQRAAETLSLREVYNIAVLSMESSHQDSLINSANTMSRPENKGERTVFCSRTWPESAPVLPKIPASRTGEIKAAALSVIEVTAGTVGNSGDTFPALKPGDIVKLDTQELEVGTAGVQLTAGGTTLKIPLAADGAVQAPGAVISVVRRPLSKSQQARTIASIARSVGNSRVRMMGPDKVRLNIEGQNKTVSGYYLAAIKAGMRAGARVGQPLIRQPVPFLTGVVGGSDRFTQAQLNVIAGGGWQLAVQATQSSQPYIRDELTTDQSRGARAGQESAQAALDYAAKTYRDTLNLQVGDFNLSESKLSLIRATAQVITGELLSLRDEPFETIDVLSIERSETEEGRTVFEFAVDQNTPYLGGRVRLFVD